MRIPPSWPIRIVNSETCPPLKNTACAASKILEAFLVNTSPGGTELLILPSSTHPAAV
jgi:hypothetical protein